MSLMISTDISCDACDTWIEGVLGDAIDYAGAAAKATRQGWSTTGVGGPDLCPDCANAKEAVPDVV